MPNSELTDFELSRVYAKGWNAGRVGPIDLSDEELDAFVETANPFVSAAERARWALGFKAGLRRSEEIDGRKNG